MTTVSRKRLETRKRLIDAARTTIANLGMSGAHVGAIAKEADFTRGAFYSNFETKDELISAVIYEEFIQLLESLESQVHAILSERTPPDTPHDPDVIAKGIADIMLPIVDALPLNTTFYMLWLELTMYSAREGVSSPQFFAQHTELAGRLSTLIETGFGEMGLTFVLPIKDVTEMVIAIIQRSFITHIHALEHDPSSTPTTFARRVLPTVMAQLSVPQGASAS